MIFSNQEYAAPSQFSEDAVPLDRDVHLNCILLVDDDKATNFLNKRLLEKLGVADTINVVSPQEAELSPNR